MPARGAKGVRGACVVVHHEQTEFEAPKAFWDGEVSAINKRTGRKSYALGLVLRSEVQLLGMSSWLALAATAPKKSAIQTFLPRPVTSWFGHATLGPGLRLRLTGGAAAAAG